MTVYRVGFDGKWQEEFEDREEAIRWAEEVAATGRVVEVVRRRFGFHKFVTGFPESEREALEHRWETAWVPWIAGAGVYGSAGGGGGSGGGGEGGGSC
jgi:hypothetical protein